MRVLLICSLLVGLSVCSPSLFYRPADYRPDVNHRADFVYPGHPNHPNTKNHNKKTKNWNRYPSGGSPLSLKQQQSGAAGQFDEEFQVSANGAPMPTHSDSTTVNFQMPSSPPQASIVQSSSQPIQQQTDSTLSAQPIGSVDSQQVTSSIPAGSVQQQQQQPELETIIPSHTVQQTFNHIPSNIAIPQQQPSVNAQQPQLETIHVPTIFQSHATSVDQQHQQQQQIPSMIQQQQQPQVVNIAPQAPIQQTVFTQQQPPVVINQPTLETIVPHQKQPVSSLEVITPQIKPASPSVIVQAPLPLETIHDIKPQVKPPQTPQIVTPQIVPVQPTIPQQPVMSQQSLETIVPIPQKPFIPAAQPSIPLETIHNQQQAPAPIAPPVQQQIIPQQPVSISQPTTLPLETVVAQQGGSACSSNPCKNHGECETRGSTFNCVCPFGFSGQFCEICTTACASNPCPFGKECVARMEGGFDCVCPADRAGPNCELQNDLCSSNPCLNAGQCRTIQGGSFVCDCVQPWSGRQCEQQFQNPCTDEVLRRQQVTHFVNPWDRKSFLICTDVNVFQSMKCPIGTHFSDTVHHCVPEGFEPHVCPLNHCLNHAECVIDSQNLARCVCLKGFAGERCEINIDECASEGGNAACAPTGTCIDQINGYFCSCDARNSSIGLNCRDAITNPCTEDNLSRDNMFHAVPSPAGNTYLQCTGVGQFVVSKCAENLFWHTDEQTCSTQPAPLRQSGSVCSSQPCLNGAECVDDQSIASYRCLCKTGFAGRNCENQIDYCASNPCQNEGKCLSYTGGYTCMCPNKVIDDCCCHGVSNPCPNRADVIPGVNDYFPHVFRNRYIHCDMDRRAFVKSCPPKTRWNQLTKTCQPEYTEQPSVRQSIYQSAYQSSYPQPVVQRAPIQAYSSPYVASALPAMAPIQQRVSLPVYSAMPVVQQQQAPVRQNSYLAQLPVPPTFQQAMPYGADSYKTLSYFSSPARQARHTGVHYNLAN